jgi:hypothetical protein
MNCAAGEGVRGRRWGPFIAGRGAGLVGRMRGLMRSSWTCDFARGRCARGGGAEGTNAALGISPSQMNSESKVASSSVARGQRGSRGGSLTIPYDLRRISREMKRAREIDAFLAGLSIAARREAAECARARLCPQSGNKSYTYRLGQRSTGLTRGAFPQLRKPRAPFP